MVGVDKRQKGNYELVKTSNGVNYFSCKICEMDTELYPKLFVQKDLATSQRKLPMCGCYHLYRYSINQYHTLLKRVVGSYYRILGILPSPSGKVTAHSKVLLRCNTHHILVSSYTINQLLNEKRRAIPCDVCRSKDDENRVRYDWKLKVLNQSDESKVNVVKGSTTILKTYIKGLNREDYCVSYRCGICSDLFNDGQPFLIAAYKYCAGKINCGCSGKYKYSPEQYERLIRRFSSSNYEFLSWKSDKINAHATFFYKCKEHGVRSARFWDWRSGNRCGLCSKFGFQNNKPADLYLIRWKDKNQTYIKFGITNNFKSRLQNLKKKAKMSYTVLTRYRYKSGVDAEDCEKLLKDLYKSHNKAPKNLLPDGWFETLQEEEVTLESLKTIISTFGKYSNIVDTSK